MKKSLFIATIASGLLLYSNSYADYVKPALSNSSTLGYAYMQGGTKLLKVSMNAESHDENVELIRITEYGFYPNYSLSNEQENAKQLIGCGLRGKVAADHTENEKLACDSHYVNREAVATALATTLTAGAAFFSFGTSALATGLPDPKYFHQDSFLEVVEKNDLQKYRTELLEIQNKIREVIKEAEQNSQSMNTLYAKALNDYKDNMNLISFSYQVTDKSGLLQDKNLDGGYSLAVNAPEKKNYSYTPFIKTETFTKEDALSKIASLKEKIDQQYQKDQKEYKLYLSTAFKNYKIVGQTEKKFAHNSNISFNATLKAPAEVPYTLGKKINITIPVTVVSANLENMVPKEYSLNDSNFIAVMGANSDLSVRGVLSNKTQSFITVKSLTCYYQNLVKNISNLDKELAPESKDLDDGTQYELLSSVMKGKANFEQITKSKADSIKINYGYAVKYKVNDTNIEKAIYNTKNYSLYDIYRQYL